MPDQIYSNSYLIVYPVILMAGVIVKEVRFPSNGKLGRRSTCGFDEQGRVAGLGDKLGRFMRC